MTPKPYTYFDEAYFENGAERGTAYVNYKEGARSSPIFREIASAVHEIFRPRRVLEIGCATGMIVRHLNDLGCEAYGVDVSDWAVRNAEHRNVILASADNLPFPDGHFDVVLSCHSLEHLPSQIFDRALAEITRVGAGFQFHMLPVVGIAPYDGEPESVRRGLRKDPTHQQLHDLDVWLGHFSRHGQLPLPASILFRHDTDTGELSTCQFLLKGDSVLDAEDVLRRAAARNRRVFREVRMAAAAAAAQGRIAVRGSGKLSYKDRIWKDAERQLSGSEFVNLESRAFQLVLIVSGGSCHLRFAAGQDLDGVSWSRVAEYHISANPGCNILRFRTEDLSVLRGKPDYSRINHLALGGENENAEILFYFADDQGEPVLE